MQHDESTIDLGQDHTFHYQVWRPDSPPVATLVIVHGFGEHAARYNYLVDALTDRDITVHGLDLCGHGRSSGKRGRLKEWGEHRRAAETLLTRPRQDDADQPLFLFGHSMGGLIALEYVLDNGGGKTQHNLAGAIISAPWLAQARLSPVVQVLARLMRRLAPDAGVDTHLDPEGISRDPAEVQRYRDDPLNHSIGTARFGALAEATIESVHARAGKWTLPLLLYHGEADPLIPIAGTHRFHATLKSDDVTFFTIPDGYHESHNDLDREMVFGRVNAWLAKRIENGKIED